MFLISGCEMTTGKKSSNRRLAAGVLLAAMILGGCISEEATVEPNPDFNDDREITASTTPDTVSFTPIPMLAGSKPV